MFKCTSVNSSESDTQVQFQQVGGSSRMILISKDREMVNAVFVPGGHYEITTTRVPDPDPPKA